MDKSQTLCWMKEDSDKRALVYFLVYEVLEWTGDVIPAEIGTLGAPRGVERRVMPGREHTEFSASTVISRGWGLRLRVLFKTHRRYAEKAVHFCPGWWLSVLCTGLWTQGLRVRVPGRAHAWLEGQVPSRGRARGNHALMFLSSSFSFPSPLCKNK